MKTLGLFEGIMSLHRLQGELVLNSAKRDATVKIVAIQKEAEVKGPCCHKIKLWHG